jgi:hypothetical protein
VSRELAILLLASSVGLTLLVGYRDLVRRSPKRVVPTVLLLVLSVVLYQIAFPEPGIETKGAIQEGVAVAICYLSMVLGMVAQYFYKQAESGERKFKFELLEFLMPIFASPIVFIPLLTVIGDMTVSGAFTKAKLMVYLVSFQNGFFWKTFFERRQQTAANEVPR